MMVNRERLLGSTFQKQPSNWNRRRLACLNERKGNGIHKNRFVDLGKYGSQA